MTIKILIFLDIILCILSVCACEDTMLDSDFSATLYIDLKKQDCNATALTLLEGEPARIITEPFYINYALYNNKQLEKKEIYDSEQLKKYDIVINDISAGKKKYTFLTNKGIEDLPNTVTYEGALYTANYCEPTFHVRMKETPLTVAINDVVLTTERTNLSVTDYDAVAHYKFRVGELADISCGKNVEYGKVSLRYRQMETTTERRHQLHTAYALKLQVKLESRDSGRYLTCRIETTTDYTTVRVYLHSDRESKDDVTVRVSGLQLRPQLPSGANAGVDQALSFLYKYKVGESAQVVCEKREGLTGDLTLNSKGVTCENDNAYCTTEIILKKNFNLDCEYLYENGSKKTADIHFRYDDMQDFYILGIPPGHIKYQYKQIKTNNVPTILSEYEYLEGETLNLTCMRNFYSGNMVYSLKWGAEDVEEMSKVNASELVKSKPIKQSLVLSSASHNRVLKCLVYESVIDPRDRSEKPKLYLTIALKLTMRKPAEKTTELPPEKDSTGDEEKGREDTGNNNKPILYGIAIGVGLCILILILMVYGVCRRKTPRKRDSNINYENLPHNPDNTLPNPSQWNEEEYARPVDLRVDTDTYSVPYNQKDVDALYAKPQPKIKNKPKETDKNVNIEPTYSEVGNFVDKDFKDSNYAQVLPKTLRNNLKGGDKNHYANTTNSSNYAEVIPKNLRKNEKNYVLPKDGSNYAEIAAERKPDNSNNYVNLNKESHYAEVVHSINNRNKYVNVFPNNEPYANSSDYAEPAYCELNVKNNKK